jgi:uncharacterized membrane protein
MRLGWALAAAGLAFLGGARPASALFQGFPGFDPPPASVPEPSALVLLASAAALVAWRARRGDR